ncbi:hypothetical protein CLIB1444_03S06194 [[Candida] jaroonii]|uniref:Uncharacterized protein n=1 Tax=[Candida] jaroonii TaxID=467808 RepID=A0ACA9Y5A4_9ASCO|nr:hypothetical protein CLIB1444_03S06194 [[Candida] jaroonii]
MELSDGEYDLDVSVLTSNHESMSIRYGQIQESINSSSMNLFKDKKNLILQGFDKGKDYYFEGVDTVYSQNSGNYYLKFENGQVKLGKLHNSVRFNKSRTQKKWKDLVDEWTSPPKPNVKRSNVTQPKIKEVKSKKEVKEDIISEADFDDLDFKMEFGDSQLDGFKFDEDELMVPDVPPPNDVSDRKDNEPPRTRSRSNSIHLDFPVKRITKPVSKTASKSAGKSTSKVASKSTGKVASKSTGKVASKTTSKVAGKRPSKTTSTIDDDFDDLEDQLDEILESSSNDEMVFEPITIMDEPTKKKNHYTQNNKKPMSLREFYGDIEESSEEE